MHKRMYQEYGWSGREVWHVLCNRAWVSRSTHNDDDVTCKSCISQLPPRKQTSGTDSGRCMTCLEPREQQLAQECDACLRSRHGLNWDD